MRVRWQDGVAGFTVDPSRGDPAAPASDFDHETQGASTDDGWRAWLPDDGTGMPSYVAPRLSNPPQHDICVYSLRVLCPMELRAKPLSLELFS